ncbi:uncharacterized protein ACNLHF_019865 [Anomaloglossus baeobatrachus]
MLSIQESENGAIGSESATQLDYATESTSQEQETPNSSQNPSLTSCEQTPATSRPLLRQLPRRMRRPTLLSRGNELASICRSILEKHDRPPVSGFAHYVDDVCKILEKNQKLHAERIIAQVLHAAQENRLTSATVLKEDFLPENTSVVADVATLGESVALSPPRKVKSKRRR